MNNEKRNGPELTVNATCFGCAHVRTERYACQGDSGCDVYCAQQEAIGAAPTLAKNGLRVVGDTRWDTPPWCPLFPAARAALVADLAQSATPLTPPGGAL
jgi:hypothetical protein